ncbi:MAG: sensor domain-containing diguanylate cyclase [Nitriliruptoraceae bacterium]
MSAAEDRRDTAGVTTRLIVVYIRRALGEDALEGLLTRAGEHRSVATLEDEATWSTYEEKIALFEAAAELTGDPLVARRIGASVLTEQFGRALLFLIGALGSPERVLRSVARANAKFSASATMRCLETSPDRGTVAYRLHEPRIPSRHDCLYNEGVLSQIPAVFGLPPAEVAHPSCQVDGAAECVYVVRWSRWRRWSPSVRRRRAEVIDTSLRNRTGDLERTVAELVSADDIDQGLGRIARRAGVAVRAQRHVLAARAAGVVHVHADGFADDEAQRLGRELLASGVATHPSSATIVSRIASTRHDYGWLAAFVPADAGFLPAEQEHLDAYAGLAAAALDVTSALLSERRSREVNEALLRLSRQLATAEDEETIAARVVGAIPLVTGADLAAVFSWDPDAEELVLVAAQGVELEGDVARRFAVPRTLGSLRGDRLRPPEPIRLVSGSEDPDAGALLAWFGRPAATFAPLVSGGELLGGILASEVAAHTADPRDATRATELRGLQGLADQAAIALARNRLLASVLHAATHDRLTGLPGRELLHDRIEQAIADHRRTGRRAGIGFLDLDGFKRVNDTAGHAAGDQLLSAVAERIRRAVRATDTVARISGDEFVVLLRDLDDVDGVHRTAAALLEELAKPLAYRGFDLAVGVSIGFALAPDHGETPDEVLRAADEAMYRVKQAGGAGYHVTPPLFGPASATGVDTGGSALS